MTRISLAVILVGFGAWEIIQPRYWVGFVPPQITFASPTLLVMLHGTVMLVVGLAVLTGFYLRIAAVLSVLIMIEVIAGLLIESGFTDLIIRDIVVLLLAVALFYDHKRYMTLNKK